MSKSGSAQNLFPRHPLLERGNVADLASAEARGTRPSCHRCECLDGGTILLAPPPTGDVKLETVRANRIIHPVHAILLASSLPLFLGALLSDWAYYSTYQIQWINFAAWLNAGAMVFLGAALLWTAIDLLRADVARDRSSILHLLVVLATFILGFIAALVHSKDAWATMPGGLILSFIVLLLAIWSVWLGFSTLRGGAR